MNEEKIEKIQQELKQLSQRQMELSKAHQQRVMSHEEQKTLFQHLFGQLPLPPDPELESVNSKIQDLKEDKRRLYDILQAAASVPPPIPEKDWSNSPFYSHTLKAWNFDYPVDQMGFYVSTLTGVGIVSKALWRSWNIRKAAEIFKEGVDSVEPGKFEFHMHNSGLNNEKNLVTAMVSRGYITGKAFAVAGLIVTGFAAFVQLKNKNRFNDVKTEINS
ncbi:hypothetical protein HDV02_006458 [Globomyces sp. JEL0801]|nr:hypothetical protein HDV02_006458 [Globomyces sp. JEL0801]